MLFPNARKHIDTCAHAQKRAQTSINAKPMPTITNKQANTHTQTHTDLNPTSFPPIRIRWNHFLQTNVKQNQRKNSWCSVRTGWSDISECDDFTYVRPRLRTNHPSECCVANHKQTNKQTKENKRKQPKLIAIRPRRLLVYMR